VRSGFFGVKYAKITFPKFIGPPKKLQKIRINIFTINVSLFLQNNQFSRLINKQRMVYLKVWDAVKRLNFRRAIIFKNNIKISL